MSAVDLTHPPAELAAFFELRPWESLSQEERALLVSVFESGKVAGRDQVFGKVPGELTSLRDLEQQAIKNAMRLSRGSVGAAARWLSIGRATLYRRLAGEEGEGVGAGARAQGGEP